MGKLLQIRVSAVTFDPDKVIKAWPRLFRLAWGEEEPGQGRGVLELAATLADKKRLGMLPEEAAPLGQGIDQAENLAQRLESALADWQASKANEFSDSLEEALSDLEKEAQKR